MTLPERDVLIGSFAITEWIALKEHYGSYKKEATMFQGNSSTNSPTIHPQPSRVISAKALAIGLQWLLILSLAILISGSALATTVIEPGAKGPEVTNLQRQLKKLGYYNFRINHYYGHQTRVAVRKFQVAKGLSSHGIADEMTLKRLGILTLHLRDEGDTVRELQAALKDRGYYRNSITGRFDRATEHAVKHFQRDADLVVDGIAGPKTLGRLFGDWGPGSDYNNVSYHDDAYGGSKSTSDLQPKPTTVKPKISATVEPSPSPVASPQPASTRPSEEERIKIQTKEFNDRLIRGQAFHNIPVEMVEGKESIIEAGIGKAITQEIQRSLKGEGNVVITDVRYAHVVRMELEVDPTEFYVHPDPEGKELPVLTDQPTIWKWYVTPLKDGSFPITVKATVRLDIKGIPENVVEAPPYIIFSDKRTVKVNYGYKLQSFTSRYWVELLKWLVAPGAALGLGLKIGKSLMSKPGSNSGKEGPAH